MQHGQRLPALAVLGLIALTLCCFATSAIADDRMAGSITRERLDRKSDKAANDRSPVGKILDIDMDTLESRGLLDSVKDGSLGEYLWENADKDDVFEMLEQLPAENRYPILFNLTERALLTSADSTLMDGRRATRRDEGRDFLTLRLERLFDIGLFDQTAALYTQDPSEPYHERQARVGVRALYISGQTALACLETNTVKDRFAGIPFWEKMAMICDQLMYNKALEILKASINKEEESSPKESNAKKQQPFLYAYLLDNKKTYTPNDLKGLTTVDLIDLAWLIHNKRLSYEKVGTPAAKDMSPALRAVLLTDTHLPSSIRDAITKHNKSYQSAVDDPPKMPEISTESFDSGSPRKRLFAYVAYLITNNFEKIDALPKDKVIELLGQLDPIDRAMVGGILEKLDKQGKLHNYVGSKIYEKHAALTFDDNYVMQSTGMVELLRKAKNENSLGEVILSGSIVLHDTPPENLRPDVFSEVIDSFVTVGLIYEAQQLTTELLLGFEK